VGRTGQQRQAERAGGTSEAGATPLAARIWFVIFLIPNISMMPGIGRRANAHQR